VNLTETLALLACVALAGYVQNLTGFAFGLVLLGLAGVFHLGDLSQMTHVVSVLTLASALTRFARHRPQLDAALLKPLLGTSLLGVCLGALLLNWMSDQALSLLRLLLGLTIGLSALLLVLPTAQRATRSAGWTFGAVGLAGGVLGGLFSTAAPPMVFHLYRQPLSLAVVRDTLIIIFASNGALRLCVMGAEGRLSWPVLWFSLLAAPLVLAQTHWMTGRPSRWPQAAVRRVAAGLLMLVGLSLAGPALFS
jgi:uncharacterized membrane protein YfcA